LQPETRTMHVNNHNCKVINIIIININNYQIKPSTYVTCITMSGGSEQAIDHIRDYHRDPNQHTTLQGENLVNTTYARPRIGHV
jgi:hypothetical protein